ncbi:MAG: beta-N-acetylhexosaminidase, partial [Propionibacteriales bacterium]|nr:beta-N-acetylhexosaminidase [Propionibacteriales bacterium]
MALHLVPRPQSVTETGQGVMLPPIVPVAGDPAEVQTVRTLLGEGPGLTLVPAEDRAMITLASGDHVPGGYGLSVDQGGVRITSADHAGLVNAVQTLRQLMPTWAYGLAPLPDGEISLPGVEILDEPRLGWRGVHLDVARHFAPLPWLLQFVDLLALHKINIFHLHLPEDQGWWFEVKKYPKLTEIASWRHGTRNPDWETDDQVPHGGYYTQDQLRSLVAYAKARGITVVPEVDVPGHVVALLTAYPEYGELNGQQIEVQRTWGVFPEVLHLDDKAVAMVKDIFTELLDVFDSEWIHVGGDECPRDQWRASEAAARLATERGLESVEHLQRWFTEHLRGWLEERGRRLVGWDEIIDEAEVPGAGVMSWRGIEPGLRAIAAGNEVVMAPGDPLYLDHYQSDAETEPR